MAQRIDFREWVGRFNLFTRLKSATRDNLSATTLDRRLSQADAALQAFTADYPAYATTGVLDTLRTQEYARLDSQGHVYLDYTGGSLYPESLLRQHTEFLTHNVFGNPHSKNLTSLAMTEHVEATREAVLRYFNADPNEYVAIFTPNATGALRLVGESYPFNATSRFLLTFDNHNSVNGIREYARDRGAYVTYIPICAPEMRIDADKLRPTLQMLAHGENGLFAYPAQSNFTGVQHSLDWIAEAQSHGWDVLLDAAAFVPTNRLDLRRWHPDFVDVSFYKMFGYPTGIGCLLARKRALQKLHRPWYAGGTITFSSVLGNGHYLTPGAAGYEDGTVNYLSIPAIASGLALLDSIGIEVIHKRVQCLTAWLIEQLLALRHRNGRPVVQLYGPPNGLERGGTVPVNFLNRAGEMIDCLLMEQRANAECISLRAGCHCNPGAREIALGLSQQELADCFRDQQEMTFEAFLQRIHGKTAGALRASLGLVSNFADVFAYVRFAQSFVD